MMLPSAGFKRNSIAFLLGVLATLALPPVFLLPLIIPAYAGLFLLVSHAATKKRAFADGWWWGWGFYISGLYWFCIALLTDPDKFAWLIPFALFALTAVIAIYQGIACWLYSYIRRPGIHGVVLFSVVWTLVEFARGHLFTGFPWNLAGYSMAANDSLLQLASLVGVYGLTFFIVFIGASFALIRRKNTKKNIIICLMVGGILAVSWGYGHWRFTNAMLESEKHSYQDSVSGVKLRLVQANISQHHKWDPKLQFDGLRKHVELSQLPGLGKITHIIWPETAVPYVLKADTTLMQRLADSLLPEQILITGTLSSEDKGESWHIWNSIVAINHNSEIVGKYNKHKLVPFGEFLPFRWLIPDGLETPVGMKDFDSGIGPETLNWPGLPKVSPLVCYEAIFPELAVAKERPGFLLNLTNDAWFGNSSGPHQHFHMARMRAVEQGLPLVRVANTGITAVTDSYGRIQKMLTLGTQGIIDTSLPLALNQPTLYSQYPWFIPILLFLGLWILIFWPKKAKKN